MSVNICYLVSGSTYHKLTLKSINYINMFYRKDKSDINYYIITSDDMISHDNITYVKPSDEISKLPLMHQRVYIPEILRKLDESITRAIFLDSDVFATGCIYDLWRHDLNQQPIGAVPHYILKTVHESLKYYNLTELYANGDESRKFFNAGMMVFDINTWLDINTTDDYMRLIRQYSHHEHYKKDEPFLNIILRDHWFILDDKWNYYPRDKFKMNRLLHPYGNYTEEKPRHTAF